MDSRDDIGDAGATGNQGRTSVDHPVWDGTGAVIAVIAWSDAVAAEALLERFDGCGWERGLFASERHNSEISHGVPPPFGFSEMSRPLNELQA
jgi:hypothetical protein